MAYSDKVLDHYNNPKNVGSLDKNSIKEELSLPPVKIHCSVLAEDAIQAAIRDYNKKQ